MSQNITFDWYYDSREKHIYSIMKDNDVIVGEFSLSVSKNMPYQLRINIDEEYQGKRYSNVLLQNFYNYVYYNWNDRKGVYILTDNNRSSRPYIELDQDMLIYIDSDVSVNQSGPSFWRKIGMKPARYSSKSKYSQRNVDSYGYELSITLRDLLIQINKKN